MPFLLQFFDVDIAVPDPFSFVLKADLSLRGPVRNLRFGVIQFNDLLVVKDHLQPYWDKCGSRHSL